MFDFAGCYVSVKSTKYRKGFNRNSFTCTLVETSYHLCQVEIILRITVKEESGIRVQRRWILHLSKELLIELQKLPVEIRHPAGWLPQVGVRCSSGHRYPVERTTLRHPQSTLGFLLLGRAEMQGWPPSACFLLSSQSLRSSSFTLGGGSVYSGKYPQVLSSMPLLITQLEVQQHRTPVNSKCPGLYFHLF